MAIKSINNYYFLPALIFCLILQFTFMPQVFSGSHVFNLVLLIIISASFLSSDAGVLYAAFFSGFIMDMFSGRYFGTAILGFLVITLCALYISNYFIKEFSMSKILIFSYFLIALYYISFYLTAYLLNSYLLDINMETVTIGIIADALFFTVFFYPIMFTLSRNNEK